MTRRDPFNMTTEKFKAAERTLSGRPKRASDLTRRELVGFVNQVHVWAFGDADGLKWDHDRPLDGAGTVNIIINALGRIGLYTEKEFDGLEIEPIRRRSRRSK